MTTNALDTIKNKLAYLSSNACLNIKKASPEIFLVGGIASIVGGTILACRATMKAEEVLAVHENEISTIAQAEEMYSEGEGPKYSEEDAKRDYTIAYFRNVGRFVKLYAPSVMLISGGIAMICASHGVMKKRNAALTAAYNAVSTMFSQYRTRVIEENENGEILDRHYMTGRDYILVDDPNNPGKKLVEEKPSDKEVEGVSPDKNVYTKCFDESSRLWKKDPHYNLTTLRCVQAELNFKLQREGHLFLNDVYEALDIPLTPAGQIVGWMRPKNGESDVTVDLGIYDLDDERKRAFVNGYERCIWICPNVQGVIYDLL